MAHIKKILLFTFTILLGVTFAYAQNAREEAKIHNRLGNLYYQQGRYEEANQEFQKVLILLEQDGVSISKQKQFKAEADSPGIAASGEYILGEADILHVSVWQNPDLDREGIVRPDGMFSFALVGDIRAAGLTITQFDQSLTKKLTEYIRNPQVSVSIKQLGGRKVIVLGQVNSPGVYSVTGARTILEAVGLAGGFTKDAVASSAILIRGGFADSAQAQRINLVKAIEAGSSKDNIRLKSEDVVFVPKKFVADLKYFLNSVLDPITKGIYTAREIRQW